MRFVLIRFGVGIMKKKPLNQLYRVYFVDNQIESVMCTSVEYDTPFVFIKGIKHDLSYFNDFMVFPGALGNPARYKNLEEMTLPYFNVVRIEKIKPQVVVKPSKISSLNLERVSHG